MGNFLSLDSAKRNIQRTQNLTCELCFGTSRSVLDPSWFGLRTFPSVSGSYLRERRRIVQCSEEMQRPKRLNVGEHCVNNKYPSSPLHTTVLHSCRTIFIVATLPMMVKSFMHISVTKIFEVQDMTCPLHQIFPSQKTPR